MSDERDVLLDRREEKYEYHVEGFDGPLDVLLFLIKKNELNIYNIDISLITEQFLEYIREHEAEIDNDDDEFEDPRQELVDKLIEYQKYKKYTELLINGRANNSFHIERNENFFLVPFEGKDLFRGVTAEKLLKTFTELMSRREPEAISKIFNTYEEVSLEEKKALLLELLETKDKFLLDDLIVHPEHKMHIICAFMTILEAAWNHLIILYQPDDFGTIYIVKRPADWDPELADQYDLEYDQMIEEDLADPSDFSILTKEAEERIRKEEEEARKDEVEFIGEEEEIDLDEDEAMGGDDGTDDAQ